MILLYMKIDYKRSPSAANTRALATTPRKKCGDQFFSKEVTALSMVGRAVTSCFY